MEYNNDKIDKIKEISLLKEMKSSFLSYAMSVIVSRALPDVRDGLKPVQRRILFGMDELGLQPDKQFKKSARIVGDVMGKYHPHGDSSIYDAMVKMAQPFNYRYPLVNGHGNFGSIDGDGAAAMRYTEARMEKITAEILKDLKKDTVDFVDNYDASEKEPKVLPAKIPNLLINGAVGIAVGMATSIPPHNLSEVIDGYIAYIQNQEITSEELMDYIKGPDFPTGGTILGYSGIRETYLNGKGSIRLRAKSDIVDLPSGKKQIIIQEIPYMVNKTKLIERIAELAKNKVIEGITDLRDESNHKGIKVIIELRRDANPEVILNNLYKSSNLQVTFSANMLALVNDEPEVLPLKAFIAHYFDHQIDILIRRTKFDLNKAMSREHLLNGFMVALANIDEIINIIRTSYDDAEEKLIERFEFSVEQTKAILAMQLRRLSGLESEKITQELVDIKKEIAWYNQILDDEAFQKDILIEEALEIKNKYGNPRLSEIDESGDYDIEDEDLIPVEDVIIAITTNGYVKRMNIDVYRTQNRGGRGKTGMRVNEDDIIDSIISTSTHNFLLFFTNLGRVYKIKGYRVPNYGRTSKGLPIVNLLNLGENEYLAAAMAIKDFEEGFLFFTTKNGVVKRTKVSDFQNIRINGIRALSLRDDDELHSVKFTNGNKDIIIGASNGKAIRFNEQGVRCMGRNAAGVRGIWLEKDEAVIGVTIATEERNEILAITKLGYGKRTDIDEYRSQGRGGKGVKTIHVTAKNGSLTKLISVEGDEDLLVVTDKGMIIRVPIDQIAKTKRATQGVKIINLFEDHEVATIALVPKDDSCEEHYDNPEEAPCIVIENDIKSDLDEKQIHEKAIDEASVVDNENQETETDDIGAILEESY